MLFNLLLLLIIGLMTAYLATQGGFTALLSFIAATFASILAAGLYEPLGSLLNGWKPGIGHGVMFFGVFFISFSILRFASDFAAPTNIRLPLWIDRAVGGVVGFLASLVVAGTIVIGIEMMPVGSAIMPVLDEGYNQFPEGVGKARASTWLNCDGFVEWIYDMTCGRGLGGSSYFEQVHPDLRAELWGYRNKVQSGSLFAQRPGLLDVGGAWFVANPDAWAGAKEKFPFDDGRALVVRTVIERGVGENISADPDGYYRASASQVRLVATKRNGESRQFYPVGYLDRGPSVKRYLRYEPLGEWGNVVMDFPTAGANVKSDSGTLPIAIEWVFAIPEGFTPNFIEVKSLARKDLTVEDKETALAANVTYSAKPWLDKPFTYSITLVDDSAGKEVPIPDRPIYIVGQSVKINDVVGILSDAAQRLETNASYASDGREGWMANSKDPGTISLGQIRTYLTQARNLRLSASKEATTSWSEVLSSTIPSAMTANGSRNVSAVRDYLENTIKPALTKVPTRVEVKTNGSGKYGPEKLGDGSYLAITWYATADTVYVWCAPISAAQAASVDLKLKTSDRNFPYRVTTKVSP